MDWWIANRSKDYYNMKSAGLAALVKELRLLGNTHAELITDCMRRNGDPANTSPHSWTIVDNAELGRWTKTIPSKEK